MAERTVEEMTPEERLVAGRAIIVETLTKYNLRLDTSLNVGIEPEKEAEKPAEETK